eukprot:CAMPEP_0113273574 /NCGR_PEP_ID=MMETSP0008_2-20120614/23924_1 /TAXON_ID=97485 /ORGANISM="Prymnesium parvum" /LENGTH=123 /DNA_ID=CAMNT_0000123101 /DNA_START=313 /DNA_END=681 /DNA_ORIENTATION=- /assembly_acc=CAM_ASM_000153
MKKKLSHEVSPRIEVMKRRVLGKLDRIWRILEHGVVRRRVIVDVHHARLLHKRPHIRREHRLLARCVHRVEVERRGAEDLQRAPPQTAVGRAQRGADSAQRLPPCRRAVKRAELWAEDERVGA